MITTRTITENVYGPTGLFVMTAAAELAQKRVEQGYRITSGALFKNYQDKAKDTYDENKEYRFSLSIANDEKDLEDLD